MSPTLAIAPKQPTRTGWALLLTSVAFFMVTLDSLVVVTALPAIHRELGGQVSTLEWAVNAYLLVFAAGIITAASIGERFGRRRVYVAGLALFSLASAACALAPSTTLLIAARSCTSVRTWARTAPAAGRRGMWIWLGRGSRPPSRSPTLRRWRCQRKSQNGSTCQLEHEVWCGG